MAITGATAMDAPFFRSLNLSDKIWNNGPISFQLQWFQQIATSVCGQSKWTTTRLLPNKHHVITTATATRYILLVIKILSVLNPLVGLAN